VPDLTAFRGEVRGVVEPGALPGFKTPATARCRVGF